VYRGLSIALPQPDALGSAPFKGVHDGDFPPCCADGDLYSDGLSLMPPLKDLGFSSAACGSALTVLDDVNGSAVRFMESDFPPEVPVDSFFKLDATTLYVGGCAPSTLGNYILDFLNQQVISIISKVRRAKFSIKADVFVNSMMCTMKIRTFKQTSGQFAVEFQRRDGDSVSFHEAFQQASAYLKRFVAVADASEALGRVRGTGDKDVVASPELAGISLEEADLLPLLEMVALPSMQADAAVSLSKLAAVGEPALWSSQVFRSICQLLQATAAEVAIPVACLIYHLAQHVEAAPYFANEGLLWRILEKLSSTGTHAQVCLQLAQALAVATQRQSKTTLSEDAAAQLLEAFSQCAARQVDREVAQNVENGHNALRSKFQTPALV